MKWVHLGQGLAGVTILIAAVIDPSHRAAILFGGIFAMAASESFYLHARAAGLANGGPETEQYET